MSSNQNQQTQNNTQSNTQSKANDKTNGKTNGKANGKTNGRPRRRRRARSMASQADKYVLYQESVQEPQSQCKFFERVFRKEYGYPPRVLREDFCAAGAVCCEWVRRKTDRRAYGYDLDPEPLDWGRRHNISALDPAKQKRVQLLCQDVRLVKGPKAHVISAENFSYFIFQTRDELRDYFKAARRNLAKEGMLVLDIMGGPEMMDEDHVEEREIDGFDYIWEHDRFDPVTNQCTFFIHFRFEDGSEMRRAFRYDWRLWSISEVRELLLEAGFSRVDVYWEGADEDGDGNGIFRPCKHAPSDPAWIAYMVGVK